MCHLMLFCDNIMELLESLPGFAFDLVGKPCVLVHGFPVCAESNSVPLGKTDRHDSVAATFQTSQSGLSKSAKIRGKYQYISYLIYLWNKKSC